MTNFPYNATRATQAAAWLVKRAGGKMSHIKLSKLLYKADREALKRWGRPIIGGNYASLKLGPVISPAVDCMKKPEVHSPSIPWDNHLRREGNSIVLTKDPGRGQLHDAAIKLLDEIFSTCKILGKWELMEQTHRFPEYRDPGKSSLPIDIKDLLKAVNKTDAEIKVITANSRHLQMIEGLIGC